MHKLHDRNNSFDFYISMIRLQSASVTLNQMKYLEELDPLNHKEISYNLVKKYYYSMWNK